jgi:hypothetical protein
MREREYERERETARAYKLFVLLHSQVSDINLTVNFNRHRFSFVQEMTILQNIVNIRDLQERI